MQALAEASDCCNIIHPGGRLPGVLHDAGQSLSSPTPSPLLYRKPP